MEDVSRLVELGFSRTDAARALHRTQGDVDKASAVRPRPGPDPDPTRRASGQNPSPMDA